MKLVLPYVGSKKRLLPIIEKNIPDNDRYIEPFAGGFSLGLNLLEQGLVSNAVLNDKDKQVSSFWTHIKHSPWELIQEVDNLILYINELKGTVSNKQLLQSLESLIVDNPIAKSALFYILKRINRGSAHKSMARDIRFGNIEYTGTFLEAFNRLTDVTVENLDYTELKKYDKPTSFWYVDPPYYGARNSTYYQECATGIFNHTELRDFLVNIEGTFILSYDDCKEIRLLYKDFSFYPIRVPSRMNMQGYTNELLISNMELDVEDNLVSYKPYEKEWSEEDKKILAWTMQDLLNNVE